MNEIEAKYNVGIFLIVSHLLIILSIVILYVSPTINGFLPDQFTTLLGIIGPMFGGYTAAIGTFIIKDRHRIKFESRPVTKSYVFLLFAFPAIFTIIILVSTWLKGFNLAFTNFENFKGFVLTMESVFAVYVGMFIYSLFERKEPD